MITKIQKEILVSLTISGLLALFSGLLLGFMVWLGITNSAGI